ncbi:30S ribosomal protein S12 methylthiotransferase RimO [Tichowtungia aerotolerans]|uniref:Ribosomal protein uS12 methylthiotransferase RimO n=1 Tax=Tichowtungia aerotolerans TaxID=2697043 RepID=A0A6P1M5Z1_9BACT|nr:30S ribosomal protein S12 methylthiotransferase RimO [Tichowtungia aerotolerans]QHI70000.1 30S ribosomal protein S12 methylthiotransferase RimO [Tichowtungia aerotolerans]
MKTPPVVSLVSLGCAKNTVDSELVLGRFAESGWMISEEPADSDICLVNTCGFIEDAREEAASVLHELKAAGGPKVVVALGCLVKRAADCPETDHFLEAADARVSFSDYSRLPEICLELLGEKAEPMEMLGYSEFLTQPRLRTGSPHTAYLKISEGCSNPCTFCSIPKIRGKQISRPMDDIVNEAHSLIEAGAIEISLIAQDTTAYGKDWDGELHLSGLLRRLRDEIDANIWFRLMYACPQHLSRSVLDVMASDPRFCPYIDMPLQHISDRMLDAMGRQLTKFQTLEKLDLIREVLPECAIRTAFIVGHPGETEEDFNELLEFVREGRFTHAGVFCYSAEPGTISARLENDVPDDVKEQRRALLMEAQRDASAANCAAQIGKTVEVIIDGSCEEGLIARSRHQAPEVDGVFFLPEFEDAMPGDRYDVEITSASDYDFYAE